MLAASIQALDMSTHRTSSDDMPIKWPVEVVLAQKSPQSRHRVRMTVPPECNEDWFDLVPNLLSSEGWEVEIERNSSSLSHCVCPWGGHIIKCLILDVTVNNAPEDSSCIFVRPETRARHQDRCGDGMGQVQLLEMLAPGEAIIKRFNNWGLLRLCTVLFGKLAKPYVEFSFTTGDGACAALQKVSRDYPMPGDCAIGLSHYSNEPPEGVSAAIGHARLRTGPSPSITLTALALRLEKLLATASYRAFVTRAKLVVCCA